MRQSEKKILLMPDSFKGSLSASRFCEIVASEIDKTEGKITCVKWPMADGGEGTVEALHMCLGGTLIQKEVMGPLGNAVMATYGMAGDLAYIEMASAAGLPLVKGIKKPLETTTFGVGELVKDAIERGAKRLLIGLGGSATNDMGCGCAAALGAKFYDAHQKSFVPTGGTLCQIASVELSELSMKLKGVSVTAMCDIENPLYGENGAAYVFGPQKGASLAEVEQIDKGLRHLASVLEINGSCCGNDKVNALNLVRGGGAAGGFGAGVVAFLQGELRSGTNYLLDLLGFEAMLDEVALIVSGEGYLDDQSLAGKTVVGIGRRAKMKNVPVIALVGGYDVTHTSEYEKEGIVAVVPLCSGPQTLEEALDNVEDQLRSATRQAFNLMKIGYPFNL